MNLKEVTDLSSIGTLFAFVLVNAGVIRMESHKSEYHTGFRVPYINGKYYVPMLCFISIAAIAILQTDAFVGFFKFNNFWQQIPMLSFLILCLGISVFSYLRNYSLIPVLGLCSNFYLMTELGLSNWVGFSIWLVLGLFIYFTFGKKHSLLNKEVI